MELRERAEAFGQGHVFRFWDELDEAGKAQLTADLAQVDFPLMKRLAETWIHQQPPAETFDQIKPVPVIGKVDPVRPDAVEALAAGEEALRAGRVGLFLVAGGQGTRLGFDGPKGSYPIGPITKKTIFAYHAEKIKNLRRRYQCTLPWYIMVSHANGPATEAFFREYGFFGLGEENVKFIKQRMVPCMDDNGRFMLDTPSHLAMNPNGHGGCIPAMVENGVIADAEARGVDTLCYFQVDNWAVKVADPYFIGYHVLANASMSSKNHRKNAPREAVGVHCLCDGQYRVIEYSELDIYPQLLETDPDGKVIYYAGNPAIHILATRFVSEIFNRFDEFPWHLAHKRVPYIDADGHSVDPDKPNAYKFETFVFDALRFIDHHPVALEIARAGEYTPIKSFSGDNSVEAAWASMRDYWGAWLEAAGADVRRDANGHVTVPIEISPEFAFTEAEFLEKAKGMAFAVGQGIAIEADGSTIHV